MSIYTYIEHIKDEIEGAKCYAVKYAEYKTEKPRWAAMYAEMAQAELKHAEYLVMMAKEYADSVSWIAEEDTEAWNKCHAKYLEKAALVKVILES